MGNLTFSRFTVENDVLPPLFRNLSASALPAWMALMSDVDVDYTSGPDWGAKASTAGEEDENKQRSTHLNWDGFRITAKPLKKASPQFEKKWNKRVRYERVKPGWTPAYRCSVWLTLSEPPLVDWNLCYWGLLVPTSELWGCMSSSVELCPMPLGMPAVRYIAPTDRFFLASLAAFISSTVTPSSAKFCTPWVAGTPSSHSRKWRLWLTAVGEKRRRRQETHLFAGMHISVKKNTTNTQTVRSFPPRSLHVFLWLPWTSCN